MFEHDYKNYPELSNSELADFGLSSPHQQITENFIATVVKVHDGDTVTLKTDFRDFDFPVRFADIDAPELNSGGVNSRDWLSAYIEGQEVEVLMESSKRVDKYGRLLGRLLFNGMVIGDEMQYLGLAVPYGKKNEGEIPPTEKLFSQVKI